MNKRFEILMPVLEIIMQCLVFLTGAVIVCYEPLAFAPGDFFRCLFVIPAVIAAWILRHKNMRNKRFYLWHAVIVIAAVIIGRNDNESFFFCILMLLLTLYSSYVMYKNERADKERPPYPMLIVMLYAFISGKSYDNNIVVGTALLSAAAFVILSVVYENLFRMKLVFRENQTMSDFPAKQLSKVNGYIIFITVAAMIAAMIIFAGIGTGDFSFLGKVGIVIGRAVAVFIIWLIEMLGKFQDKAPAGQNAPSGDVEDKILEYMTMDNGNGTIERIINAVIVVVAIMLVIAVIFALIKALNRFMQRENVKLEGSDVIEFVRGDSKKSRVRAAKVKEEPVTGTDNEKLRKMYRKMVKRGMKKNGRKMLSPSMTPSDITNSNITDNEAIAAEITSAYEIARYSDDSVTKQDIEKLKKSYKNKKSTN